MKDGWWSILPPVSSSGYAANVRYTLSASIRQDGRQTAQTADNMPDDANPAELKAKANINLQNPRRLSTRLPRAFLRGGSPASCSRPSCSPKIRSHPPRGSEHLQRAQSPLFRGALTETESFDPVFAPDWPDASGA